ncbi:hypothetical protein MMYC01_210576 [Madurella mycetomatis]|uniref:Uncharacterized protein n=1 Tax=Madurella mycetomatis TaxID=100816 RepID=A0A175VP68_9PEZI|nr:hypothetical protein MMYC01_210576 [Madurella mycetomatis]
MSADSETAAPAWGALPVEQYLIRNWDHSSELSTEEQRRQLVEAYIDEGVLDLELLSSPPSRVPTDAEVADILAPWRPQKLRRIAAAHLGLLPFEGQGPHFYLLRTYYGGGADDDAKLRSWLDENLNNFDIEPEYGWFSVLDDAELFGVGDCWQEVYDLFPELAAPEPDRRFTEEHVAWALKRAKRLIKNDPDESEDEHYADAIRQVAALGGPPWLIVIDEEAFRTEELGLIFRDLKGNPVKEAEIEPYMLNEFYGRYERGMMYEGHWEHANVPKKYRVPGEIMRRLLPLVKGESLDVTRV